MADHLSFIARVVYEVFGEWQIEFRLTYSFVSFVVYTTTRQSAVLSITWTSHVMPVHTLYKLLEDRTVSKYWPTITRTLVEGVPGARVGTFRILLAALVFFVPLSHWTTVSHGFLQIALPV